MRNLRSARWALVGVMLLAGLAGAACQKTRNQMTVRQYPMEGKVLAVDVQAKQATIAHGDIPGFMGAMTMAYPIKDEAALAKLKKGDEIKAVVVVDDTKGLWLDQIQIVKPPADAK